MTKLSIIIPIYNEQDNIPKVVEALKGFDFYNIVLEVIWVDDGSKDQSIPILQSQDLSFASNKIIVLSQNYGSHAALRAGITKAEGDYITFLYADLQDPIEVIYQMIQKALNETLDIVLASRAQSSGLTSSLYAKMMRKWVSSSFPKNGFDMMLFNKSIKDILNAHIETNSSLFLQILTLGFRQGQVTYKKEKRQEGKSKWSLSKKIKLFMDSLIAFSYIPIRYVTMLGGFISLLGIVFMSYLILRKIIYNDLVQGWTMLVSVLMLGFGVTNVSLGIIAEYLWRNLDATRKRPVFIIKEYEEFLLS